MAYQFLSLTREDRVLRIALDRPPANALGTAFGLELRDAFLEAEGMEGVAVVVIESRQEKAWIAGADIKEMAGMDRDASEAFSRLLQGAFSILPRMRKVVIAAISGHALGGGCELALACDFRFMARGRALIGLPEAGLGILPGAGGTQRLPRLLGTARALDILLRARTFGADEAVAVGLVDAAFEAEGFLDAVLARARELAAGAGQALGRIKAAVHEGAGLPMDEALVVERRLMVENLATRDAAEGLAAFVEKRKPNFENA